MAPQLTLVELEILTEAAQAGQAVARTYHCSEQDAVGWAKQAACERLVARRLLSLDQIKGSQYSPVEDVLWTYALTEAGQRAARTPA